MALCRRSLLLGAAGAAVAVGLRSLAGCEAASAPAPDRGVALASFVDVVALPMLGELRARAEALPGALDALAAQPSLASLDAARAAWDTTREAYYRTLAFGLGPADDIAITGGAIDEPTDPGKLDALVASGPPADEARVRSAPASVRGFLAIEALLFASDVPAGEILLRYTSDPQAAGRAALLRALGVDLRDRLVAVAAGWAPDGGNFAGQIRSAGEGSATFRERQDALDALLNQALSACDLTLRAARRSSGLLPDEKAPVTDRSDRQLRDLLDVLAGIEALYTGQWRGRAGELSIAALVVGVNRGADDAMRGALAGAKAALGAFPPPLRGAVGRQEPAEELIGKLRAVKTALAMLVFNALGVTTSISDQDGD